jgi:RNA polymerase sigma factor (sigma-70 family)
MSLNETLGSMQTAESSMSLNDAFEHLLKTYDTQLKTILARLSIPLDEREDVRQEVWQTVWKILPKGELPPNISAWLTTVAKRKAIDIYRATKRNRTDFSEDVKTLESRSSPQKEDFTLEFVEYHLKNAMAQLKGHASVIGPIMVEYLKKGEHLKIAQIQKILEESGEEMALNSIKRAHGYLIQKCRESIAKECKTESQ